MPRAKQYDTKKLYFPDRVMEAMQGILDHPLTIIERRWATAKPPPSGSI